MKKPTYDELGRIADSRKVIIKRLEEELEEKRMIPLKSAVWFDSELFGRKLKAYVTGHDEGWYKLCFADGSEAIVRPSKVSIR